MIKISHWALARETLLHEETLQGYVKLSLYFSAHSSDLFQVASSAIFTNELLKDSEEKSIFSFDLSLESQGDGSG